MFDNFIKQLRSELQKDLPGKEAHLKMASSLKDYAHLFDHKNKERKKSGVLLLLYPFNDQIYSVLIQRPEYPGYHSGQIGFPGGMAEPEDIGLKKTALRETFEEIGVLEKEIQILNKLSMFFIPVSNIEAYPFVGYVPYRPEFKLDPVEVVEIIEYPVKELLNKSIVEQKNMVFRNIDIKVPYYNLNGHHVWGATAMMLAEFSEILSKLDINL